MWPAKSSKRKTPSAQKSTAGVISKPSSGCAMDMKLATVRGPGPDGSTDVSAVGAGAEGCVGRCEPNKRSCWIISGGVYSSTVGRQAATSFPHESRCSCLWSWLSVPVPVPVSASCGAAGQSGCRACACSPLRDVRTSPGKAGWCDEAGFQKGDAAGGGGRAAVAEWDVGLDGRAYGERQAGRQAGYGDGAADDEEEEEEKKK